MSAKEPLIPTNAYGPNQGTELTQAMSPEETASAVIDRYHMLQKIGEGGMGEVWLAEQKEPVRRRVALKLAKAGMSSREVIARFESERQALALMDHPAIAKVLDAGSTPQGAPYFVMEYVAGVSISTYCDSHRLNTRDRLELFMRVCEGIQHAHQKAIHPPRPETIEHPRHRSRRASRAEDYRFWRGQGADAETDRGYHVYARGGVAGNPGIHEP
jgi:Protein tyrosine and serine/threonine kinase